MASGEGEEGEGQQVVYSHSMVEARHAMSHDHPLSLAKNLMYHFQHGAIFAFCGRLDGTFTIWAVFHYHDVMKKGSGDVRGRSDSAGSRPRLRIVDRDVGE